MRYLIILLLCSFTACQDHMAEMKFSKAKMMNNARGEKQIALDDLIRKYPNTDYADSAKILLENIVKQNEIKLREKQIADSLLQVRIENELREKKNELKVLKKKFNKSVDDFDGAIWYKHKDLPAKVKKYTFSETLYTPDSYIEVPVRGNGTYYLKSIYNDSRWIFHTKIAVNIAGELLYSLEVPSYSDNNDRDTEGPGVTEIVHFLNGKDNGIIKAISESNTNDIRIRQIGDKYNELKLTPSEIQAIKETVRLGELIQELE